MENKQEKILYLEFLRIIGIFLVILSHTQCLYLYIDKIFPSVDYFIYSFIGIFAKVAIFIFLTISGAVLLNKEEPISKIYLKRIPKILFWLLVISLIYYLKSPENAGKIFSLGDFLISVYSKCLTPHVWFLYLYLLFLIFLPFIRNMVKNIKVCHFYYLVAVISIYELLNLAEFYFFNDSVHMEGNLNIARNLYLIVLYPAIGYFFEHRIDINNFMKKYFSVFLILSVVLTFIIAYLLYIFDMRNLNNYELIHSVTPHVKFMSQTCTLNCIIIFPLTKFLFTKINFNKISKNIIYSLGSCAFGIYLFHPFILDSKFINTIHSTLLKNNIDAMMVEIIISLLILFITYIIIYPFKKIPIIKKIL